MRKRLDHIDRAKGILIILMVIGHIWQSGLVFDLIYTFHMPAFFMISGLLMQYTKSYQKPYLSFVKTRILSYGIPFLFIEGLGCLTDILRNGVTLNIKGYLYNTLTFHFNDSNLWFLVDLCLIELLFAALSRCVKSRSSMLGISVILFFTRYILPTELPYISTISSVFKYYPLFVLGFYFHDLLQKENRTAALACTVVVVICAIFEQPISSAGRFADDIAYIIGGICGTYMTIIAAQKIKSGTYADKVLSHAGRNTLIIYGTHHFYYAALGVLLGVRNFAATPLGTGILILAIVLLLEVPTISVINRWFPWLAGKRKTK